MFPSLISAVSSLRTSGVNLQAGSHVRVSSCGAHLGALPRCAGDSIPSIGRNFSEEEDRPHGPKTAILSYRLWRNIFGCESAISGAEPSC